ncbi:MAG: S-layer homology domain-containing protein, partial [Clostridia bacterium]|nr:S-layer homology domain-containing protein [Clostridia bacterium]
MATWHGLLAQTDYNNKTSIFDRLHNLNKFNDLKESDYGYKEMMTLVNKGVLSGYQDGTLKPENPVKRGEFTKLLIYGLSLQNKLSNKTNQFSDLTNHWSNRIVKVAVDMGIMNGMEINKFYPESKITGAQVAVILVRYKGFQDLAEAIEGGKWYEGYIKIAEEQNLLYDNFNPEKFATRAQCAQAIYKLIN